LRNPTIFTRIIEIDQEILSVRTLKGRGELNKKNTSFINRLEIVLTVGSPHPALSPNYGGEGKGEGASGRQYKYETINMSDKSAVVRDFAKPLFMAGGRKGVQKMASNFIFLFLISEIRRVLYSWKKSSSVAHSSFCRR
jgi:hypothetical protein